jgi:hypothetical protein
MSAARLSSGDSTGDADERAAAVHDVYSLLRRIARRARERRAREAASRQAADSAATTDVAQPVAATADEPTSAETPEASRSPGRKRRAARS